MGGEVLQYGMMGALQGLLLLRWIGRAVQPVSTGTGEIGDLRHNQGAAHQLRDGRKPEFGIALRKLVSFDLTKRRVALVESPHRSMADKLAIKGKALLQSRLAFKQDDRTWPIGA